MTDNLWSVGEDFLAAVDAARPAARAFVRALDNAQLTEGHAGGLGDAVRAARPDEVPFAAEAATEASALILRPHDFMPALSDVVSIVPWSATEKAFPGRRFFEAMIPVGAKRLRAAYFPKNICLHVELAGPGASTPLCWRYLGTLTEDVLVELRLTAQGGIAKDVAVGPLNAKLEAFLNAHGTYRITDRPVGFSGDREKAFTIFLDTFDRPTNARSVLIAASAANDQSVEQVAQSLTCRIEASFEMGIKVATADVVTQLVPAVSRKFLELLGLGGPRRFRTEVACARFV